MESDDPKGTAAVVVVAAFLCLLGLAIALSSCGGSGPDMPTRCVDQTKECKQ